MKSKVITLEKSMLNAIRFFSFDQTSLAFADVQVEIKCSSHFKPLILNIKHEINPNQVNLNVLDYKLPVIAEKTELLLKSETYDLENIGVFIEYLDGNG
jgi:hypothetical protein